MRGSREKEGNGSAAVSENSLFERVTAAVAERQLSAKSGLLRVTLPKFWALLSLGLLAAKTYSSVFYDKLTPSIARGKW